MGRLGILPRPRGGDWLGDETAAWHEAGVDMIVSLLEPEEAAQLILEDEAAAAAGGERAFRKPVLMLYQPFIDDPEHIKELDGQRFVVLRPAAVVSDCHRRVQDFLRQHLSGSSASYPARAHVTLAGFAAGTPLEAVQELVSAWARGVPPLRIEVEGATSFPPPFQIALLKVVKTAALFAGLQGLRQKAEQRGLTISTVTPAEQWVFHMSLAYCSRLNPTEWNALAQYLETQPVPSASCVQETVEIVAFDGGRECSGGMFSLSREATGSRLATDAD